MVTAHGQAGCVGGRQPHLRVKMNGNFTRESDRWTVSYASPGKRTPQVRILVQSEFLQERSWSEAAIDPDEQGDLFRRCFPGQKPMDVIQAKLRASFLGRL